MKKNAARRFLIIALALVALPATAAASDWNWNLTPYIWLAETTVDIQVNDQEVFVGQAEFSDLIDDADGAIMAHLEGRRGENFGVFADLIVGDFGDDARDLNTGGIPVTAESDLELTLLDVGGVWYAGGDSGFGVHYGVRLIDIDNEVDARFVGPLAVNRRIYEIARTEIDGLVGVRYVSEVSSGWSFAGWIDVSAGGSDGSWGGALVAGYHFGSDNQYAVRFGYRHLQLEVGDEDRQVKVETDLALSGPMVGFTFSW